jgi:hypothetical protein
MFKIELESQAAVTPTGMRGVGQLSTGDWKFLDDLGAHLRRERLRLIGVSRESGTNNNVLVVEGGSSSPSLRQFVKAWHGGIFSDVVEGAREAASDTDTDQA